MARDTDALKIRKWAENGDVENPEDGAVDRSTGWDATYSQPGGPAPKREHFNELFREHSALGVEINTRGLLEWDSSISYIHPALVMGSDALPYISVADNVGIDPITDSSRAAWVLLRDRLRVTLVPTYTRYTTPGPFTYTVPPMAQMVFVECIGGGGGGAGGRSDTTGSAAGGTGGYVNRQFYLASTLGDTVSGFVGAGGAGGAKDVNGSSGGTSGFADTIAYGGYGGRRMRTFTPPHERPQANAQTGANGGTGGSGRDTAPYASGGDGFVGAGLENTGGAGGAAGSSSVDGGTGGAGTSTTTGLGGGGGGGGGSRNKSSANPGTGGVGGSPGGGGGGGGSGGTYLAGGAVGGMSGRGEVRIWAL